MGRQARSQEPTQIYARTRIGRSAGQPLSVLFPFAWFRHTSMVTDQLSGAGPNKATKHSESHGWTDCSPRQQ